MTETLPVTSSEQDSPHAAETLSARDFRDRMSSEYGIDALEPRGRIEQLKQLSVEGVAIMLEDINKTVQHSSESLMNHDAMTKIGDKETIKPEDRYDVFVRLVEAIKQAPDTINPARVADTLALGVVLLHPFRDGNGRTARTLGLMFRDNYDGTEYSADFATVTEPRDDARERGGFMINGYVPYLPDGYDQSNPEDVSNYLSSLLVDDNAGRYTGTFGQAPLHE